MRVSTAVTPVGAMSIAGESFNIINNIIPVLVIIIGVSDAVHLVSHRPRGARDRTAALLDAAREVAAPCAITTWTTGLALLSFATSFAAGLLLAGGMIGVPAMSGTSPHLISMMDIRASGAR